MVTPGCCNRGSRPATHLPEMNGVAAEAYVLITTRSACALLGFVANRHDGVNHGSICRFLHPRAREARVFGTQDDRASINFRALSQLIKASDVMSTRRLGG